MPRALWMPCLTVAVPCYSVAQLVHSPVSNALSADAAPVDIRGRYIAVFQYSFALAAGCADGGWSRTERCLRPHGSSTAATGRTVLDPTGAVEGSEVPRFGGSVVRVIEMQPVPPAAQRPASVPDRSWRAVPSGPTTSTGIPVACACLRFRVEPSTPVDGPVFVIPTLIKHGANFRAPDEPAPHHRPPLSRT